MKNDLRSHMAQLLRYLLAIIVLLWVVSRGQWQETIDALIGFSTLTIIMLAVLTIGGLLFRFLMWYAFITCETPVKFKTAAKIDLIINFLNQLLPSRLSGRAAAPLIVSRYTNVDLGTSIGIAGINTAVYGIVYGIVGIFGIVLSVTHLSWGVSVLLTLSTVLYLAAGSVILILGLNSTVVNLVTKQLTSLFDRIPGVRNISAKVVKRTPEFTDQSETTFQRVINSPPAIGLYLTGWIGSIAVFPALRVATLFFAFDTPFSPLLTLPAVLVAAYSITLLPLTPGGLGVTEATAAAVFVSLGVPYEVATASILVDRVLGVYLPALLGWYPMIRENPLTTKTG